MWQEVRLIGNIGKIKKEEKYSYMSVATKKTWKNKEGQWEEKTVWHNVMGYKYSKDAIGRMEKGDQVLVCGEISYKEDGAAFIIADKVKRIKKSNKSQGAGDNKPDNNSQAEGDPSADDDLPF